MITIRPLEEKDVAAVSAIESRTFFDAVEGSRLP